MLKNRRIVLETTDSLLTRGELSAGYHFCQYNMRNIVGPDDDEWKDCLCPIKEKIFPTPKFGAWIECLPNQMPADKIDVIVTDGENISSGCYIEATGKWGGFVYNKKYEPCLRLAFNVTHWMIAPEKP